jgi:hypothetical protein
LEVAAGGGFCHSARVKDPQKLFYPFCRAIVDKMRSEGESIDINVSSVFALRVAMN